MSLEDCLKQAREEREAEGIFNQAVIRICLRKNIFDFPRWAIWVHAYGQSTKKGFWRRASANDYFDELKDNYGLKETEAY